MAQCPPFQAHPSPAVHAPAEGPARAPRGCSRSSLNEPVAPLGSEPGRRRSVGLDREQTPSFCLPATPRWRLRTVAGLAGKSEKRFQPV